MVKNARGGKPRRSFNPGISYVRCRYCGRRGFTVWNQASAEAWYQKHEKECRMKHPDSSRDSGNGDMF